MVNLPYHVLRDKFIAIPDLQRGMVLPPPVQLVDPLHMVAAADELVELQQDVPDIADDGHTYLYVLADFSRVYIYMYHSRVAGECADHARGPVIKPHADGNDDIGPLPRLVGRRHAMHAQPSKAEHMHFRETADTQQGRHHGYLCLFRHLLDLVPGLGDKDAPAPDDDRLFGFVDDLGGFLDLRRMPEECRLIAWQVDLMRIGKIGLVREDILGNIN